MLSQLTEIPWPNSNAHPVRLILKYNIDHYYFQLLECFKIHNQSQAINNIWRLDPNVQICSAFMTCLAKLVHLFKAILVSVEDPKSYLLSMRSPNKVTSFFEFVTSLLKNIPQYQNLLRYLVFI